MKQITSPREQDRAMSYCINRGYKIYPVPYYGKFKIVIQKPRSKHEPETVYTSDQVFDKIRELYEALERKLTNKKQLNPTL